MIRSNTPLAALAWLLVCGCLLLSSAQAADMTALYTQEIRKLYRTGKQLVQQKRYKRAVLKFKAALALIEQSLKKLKTPKDKAAMQKRKAGFLYIIARTYHYDQQPDQAFLYYQESLVSGAKGKTAVLATSRMHQLRPKVLVQVDLNSTPNGVSLRLRDALNKETLGRTPFSSKLPPGTYRLTLSKPGYKERQTTLVIPPKAPLKTSFALEKILVAVELRSVPSGASVELQATESKQRYTGVAPLRLELPPGQYALRLTLKGHQPRQVMLQLKDTKMRQQREFTLSPIPAKRRVAPRVAVRPVRPLPPLPHPKQSAARAAGWTTLIVAALAGGGSAALYFLANDAIETYNERAGNPTFQGDSDAIYGDYSRGQTMRIAAHVTVGVAAASAITALSMFIWNGGPPPTRQTPPPGTNARTQLLLP